MTNEGARRWSVVGVVVGVAVGSLGCTRPSALRPDETDAVAAKPVASASASSAVERAMVASASAKVEPVKPKEPAAVEQLRVPGDSQAAIVRAGDGRPPVTVFLPGVCSNATAYLMAFPEAARTQGGVVAIDGDAPCPGVAGFHTFSWDPERQHARIEAALAAAGLTTIPKEGITIVGYSQGATIAEKLVYAHPDRYGRAFVIAAPTDPSIASFQRARGVVTGACSLDVTARMKTARDRLLARNVPSSYVEMPGCTHGNVADGENVFDSAFSFLRAKSLPAPEGAVETTITGVLPKR